jgi:hypothetical protein
MTRPAGLAGFADAGSRAGLKEAAMASPKISHLILNTANYEAMKQWYLDVFEAEIGVETSDHSALGAVPFDPALLAEELDGGKTVAELTAWSPRTA